MSGTPQRVAISRLNRFHVYLRTPNRSRSQPAIRPTSLFCTFTSLGERAQVYVILWYSSSVWEVTSSTHDSSTTDTSLGELCPSQVGVARDDLLPNLSPTSGTPRSQNLSLLGTPSIEDRKSSSKTYRVLGLNGGVLASFGTGELPLRC